MTKLRYACVALLLAACGGALSKPTAGGESHFLRECHDDCGQGLQCISGLCTRGCVVDKDSCADLAKSATCTDASVEPGAVAVCDVSCNDAPDCAAFGASFACVLGFCRGPVLPGQAAPPSPGSAGAPNVAAPAYTAPNCYGQDGPTPSCPDGLVCVSAADDIGNSGICVSQEAVCGAMDPNSCPPEFVCVDADTDAGYCSPKLVDCQVPEVKCDEYAPECPFLYARSRWDDCNGPCVPIQNCGCTSDDQCPAGHACDVSQDHCVAVSWKAPALCSRPFPVETCEVLIPGFSLVDGKCDPATFTGCDRPANLFFTLDECMAVCEGRPVANDCPDGRIRRTICISCGVAGGCGEYIDACAKTCDNSEDCQNGLGCGDGVCQAWGCE